MSDSHNIVNLVLFLAAFNGYLQGDTSIRGEID